MNIANILSNPNHGSLETIDRRLQKSIAGNFADGNITAGQALSLEKGMVNINRMEHNARSDGHTTLQEAGQILGAQFVEARRIIQAVRENQAPPPQPALADAPVQPDIQSVPSVDVSA